MYIGLIFQADNEPQAGVLPGHKETSATKYISKSLKPYIMLKLNILFYCIILSTEALVAQKLNRDEKKVVSIVDANMDQAINFLEKTVNINSGTNNLDGVRQVGEVFKIELDGLGFETKWIDMPRGNETSRSSFW